MTVYTYKQYQKNDMLLINDNTRIEMKMKMKMYTNERGGEEEET